MIDQDIPIRIPPPSNRTYEQLLNHHQIESELALKLKNAPREERTKIFLTMYDELFAKVPDHPRLRRRKSEELTEKATIEKFSLISRHIKKDTVFAEFAPGDCYFANFTATQVKTVYGIDISDQREPGIFQPDNFKLIIYNGYDLTEIPDNSIDVFFSDQLIEHFHPDDTPLHFELVLSKLKPGGKYIFRTPHGLTGPHDISKYFSHVPTGFHLKEWTHFELNRLVKKLGYRKYRCFRYTKGRIIRLPFAYFSFFERILPLLFNKESRISKFIFPSILTTLVK